MVNLIPLFEKLNETFPVPASKKHNITYDRNTICLTLWRNGWGKIYLDRDDLKKDPTELVKEIKLQLEVYEI